MEGAGQPRHRSHNPTGEGERAGCYRINPSMGGLVNGEQDCHLMIRSSEGQFQPQAVRYRARIRLFIALFLCAVPLSAAAAFVPQTWTIYFGVPAIVCVLAALITFFTLPRLLCPACGKSADAFDQFCPVCGVEALHRYQVTAAKCEGCGRTLGHYRYRNYKIHFCTHCGALLDRSGV